MRKQACRKCIFWELLQKESEVADPKMLELIRCDFETYFDNPKDTECKHMEFARKVAKSYGFI